MKHLLLILSLLARLILAGQDITPIPADTTSQWRISRGYHDGICVNWYNSIYYINGTTEVNGKVYYEVFESGDFYQTIASPPGPCNQTYSYSGVYRGTIRSEDGKTYERYENEEYLLMDFNLNVGDTLVSYLTPGLVIESIDSVMVGTQYRKRFNFLNWGEFNWMIEGIGHAFGLFEPMGEALSFSSEFHCYGENNVPLYGDLDCTLNVGYKEISKQIFDVSIYPNPTSNTLTADASQLNNKIESYALTDIYGRMIFPKNTDLKNYDIFEIDLSKYTSGIYFLRLGTENQGIIIRKIIKN